MSKPIAAPVSAGVRTCPVLSLDKRRGEDNKKSPPLTPPPAAVAIEQALALDPIPLAVRRLRVEHGSNRKRDLAAVAMADELELLLAVQQSTEQAAAAWQTVSRALRESVPESTYRIWFEPLRPLGAQGDALILTADEPRITAWAERRYRHHIAEALQQETEDFTRVKFVGGSGA